ncbi:MAG: complex I subunit 5 family protein [Vicinamibacterales bacterium]
MSAITAALVDAPWIVWVMALPLVSATAAFVARSGAAWVGMAGSCATAASVAALASQVWQGGSQRYPIGGWASPLGIDLYADGLSVCLLLLTAVIGVPTGLYATAYFSESAAGPGATASGARRAEFWVLWLFLWAALNALFLSGDAFNLYVTLELVTLSGVSLVALAGTRAAIAAALRYLLVALFGSLLYLLGVALLYAGHGVLDVATLGSLLAPGTTLADTALAATASADTALAATASAGAASAGALSLIVVGLAFKGALFPMHVWLPPAHASAPAPVSAVLSGLVVTASFYVLLRLWFDAFAGAVSGGAGTVLAVLGAAAIGWGSLQALRVPGLKALVAYSTVAQLGYLFLVFGLTTAGDRSEAWTGGVLFALSHGCAKASLFLAAGCIVHAAGHDRIAELGGVGRRLPVTFFTIALASVTLMGLPPSGAFVAKWMLLQAALDGGRLWVAVVILAGGLLAAGYLFRILGQAFTPSSTDAALHVPGRMVWPALVLAVVALGLGLGSAPIVDLLQVGALSTHTLNETAGR